MASSTVGENMTPAAVKRVLKETKEVLATPVDGVKVLPSSNDDPSELQAIVEGPRDTPYAGGHFLIRLKFGGDYPQAPPKGFFITQIFHPNVSKAGEICVNTLKRDWKPTLGLAHILLSIKCLLIEPNPESALNEEAGMLLLDHYDDYAKRARFMTELYASRPCDGAASASTAVATSTDTPVNQSCAQSAGGSSSSSAAPPPKRAVVDEKRKRALKRL